MGVIGPFKDEFFWLSNFYIEPDKTHVEGEYQALKSDPPTEWLKYVLPHDAKRAGRKLKLRKDWDEIKIGIMQGLVTAKFNDHPELMQKLIETRPHTIIELNNWNDTFWGVYRGYGQNWLGRILMHVRDRRIYL